SGTNEPLDDTFTFEVLVTGENVESTWQIAGQDTTYAYGTLVTVGPFLISEGSQTLSIQDVGNTECSEDILVLAPGTCSPTCAISAVTSNVLCNDEGTNDPSDDTFTFEVVVTGENTGPTWIASNGNTGTYNISTTFGPFLISSGDVALGFQDEENPGCITQIFAQAPPSCSPTCAIAITTLTIFCNDNGTLSQQNDDFYEVVINAAATNGGPTDTFEVLVNNIPQGQFAYNQGGTFSLPADGSMPQIQVRDITEPDCIASDVIGPLFPCTDACAIAVAITNVVCDNQGTGNDSTDDTYTFNLVVNGQNTSGQWQSADGTLSGNYGQIINAGPYFINDGNLALVFQDLENPGCLTSTNVVPPAACSFCLQTVDAGSDFALTCKDTQAPLQATSSATGTYEWSLAGNTVSTALAVTVSAPGTYLFTATYPDGCIAQDSVVVSNSNEIPRINLISVSPERCFGENNGQIIFEDIEGGAWPYEYQINGQIGSSQGIFNQLPPGEYNIEITDAKGCMLDTLITIEEGVDLEIRLPELIELLEGNSGRLVAGVSIPEEDLETIQWSPPGQVACDTCLVTTPLTASSQTYIITVVHDNGCEASATVQLLAPEGLDVYIPTAFSPDGNDVNDNFTLFSEARVVEISSMIIFDRWGEKVFQAENIEPNRPEFGWDGNLRGRPMAPQVFVYVFELLLDDGSKEVFSGDFVLMR
ncbi:MAG: gliding motility-associated-like protein, partial [Neolewinella sp.]